MREPTIAAKACVKMIDMASHTCQTPAAVPPTIRSPDWDAMAVSFASLSNAFAWGSLILALTAILTALAWGKIVTDRAEREAREMAEKAVKKWLTEDAPPLVAREAIAFMRTFRGEAHTSDADLAKLVAAAGHDDPESDSGKE